MQSILEWKSKASWPTEWPRFESWEPDDLRLGVYAHRLLDTYSAIRCFHGARPRNWKSYYERGILPSDSNVMATRAREIFCGELGMQREVVDRAVMNLGARDLGRLYLALDDRCLIDLAGQYLVYGSEYLLALVNQFPAELSRLGEHLRNVGTPTVYEVEMPLEWVSERELCELAWYLGREQLTSEPPLLDFTVKLNRPVPGDMVVDHYHPTRVRDWHQGGMYVQVMGSDGASDQEIQG